MKLPEITLKVILLSVILAAVLAASNTFLALKIGILTTASIPAAVLSMGILRFFKGSNILQNNLVQTAASAGEAIAGGIVYTIPALIIIHYWTHFNYIENFGIALIGGTLGVLFSIPLRRVLVNDKQLPFPEGRAIAEVLLLGSKQHQHSIGLREMISGGAVGALIELAQNGVKLMASNMQAWFVKGNCVFGFGAGFSATLIGAGYLIGFNVGLSLLMGAVLGWLIAVPLMSVYGSGIDIHTITSTHDVTHWVLNLWSEKIRYIGIGAMLTAGVWTLLHLFKPFYDSIRTSMRAISEQSFHQQTTQESRRSEQDMPGIYVLLGIGLMMVLLYGLFNHLFPIDILGLSHFSRIPFVLSALIYVLFIGFIFSAICAYFSGLVGVTASPGSAIMIGSLLLAALLLRAFLALPNGVGMSATELSAAAAVIIMIGSVVMGSAALADNIQVLKVGHIVGATPWKQQLMLLLGVLVAAAVVPLVMELLYNVYGIAGVYPRPNMDPLQALAAPPAAMMATMTQGIFNHILPWDMIAWGIVITSIAIVVNARLKARGLGFSVLGMAMGIYLPLPSSTALFLGSAFALISKKALFKDKKLSPEAASLAQQKGLLLACGLVSGAALMDVVLAIPFAILKNPDALSLLPKNGEWIANGFGIIMIVFLGAWFYRVVVK